MSQKLNIGQKFEDFFSFEIAIQQYQNAENVQFFRRNSRTIAKAQLRMPEKKLNERLKYYDIQFHCIRGGKNFKWRSTGMREQRCFPRMAYQKVYMNQIHSSSLLCQLAQMWRDEVLCDAYIRAGSNNIKAHRVVLVAACPMLQSMDGSFSGSMLEVKLTTDIQPDSVFTFLQYLYEGFMVLTEDNVREVEKIAGLLQVDSITKCCSDFHKVLQQTTGTVLGTTPKCCFHADQAEFRHVRSSGLMRSAESQFIKRGGVYENNDDVPFKRARVIANDICNSLPQRNNFSRQNVTMSRQSVEDSFEIIQTDKDGLKPKIHQNLGLKVASHSTESASDIHVINIPDSDIEQNSFTSSRQSPFMVVNPNKHLAISGTAVRKHSPKTITPNIPSAIKNQPARSSLFTSVSPVNIKMSECQKGSEQPEQIIIQPITEGDNSPVSVAKGDETEDRNRIGTVGSDDPCELSVVKVEKPGTTVAMETDSHGDVDRPTDTSLHDDDGEDEYSEGEIYRYADTSGMAGAEDEPGNAWYIDTLKEWLRQSDENEDFENLPLEELDDLLTKFYSTSVLPKEKLWNYPSQVTQYLNSAPWFRGINICSNSAFESSNSIATKSYTPSQSQVANDRRKLPMTQEDLNKLYESGVLSNSNPTSLQNKVWVELMIYVGGLARQDLRNLEKDHFIFEKDDNGKLYYRLDAHFMMDSKKQIRVYEQPDNLNCPVHSLWLYLSKLNPKCPVFFQQPLKEAVTVDDTVWYSHRPIGKNAHSTWLASICKEAGITTEYRNTALYCRTAPQVMKSEKVTAGAALPASGYI